jgi:hypothetical protein
MSRISPAVGRSSRRVRPASFLDNPNPARQQDVRSGRRRAHISSWPAVLVVMNFIVGHYTASAMALGLPANASE